MASHHGTGSFHHVIVMLKGSDKKKALFTDLAAGDLKRRFVRPYKQGKPVLLPDNSVVQTRDITWTTIRTTAEAAAPTLEALEEASRRSTDELNRGGGVVFLGRFAWGDEDWKRRAMMSPRATFKPRRGRTAFIAASDLGWRTTWAKPASASCLPLFRRWCSLGWD